MADTQYLTEILEMIRCNSEPDTLGTFCTLPEATEPHTREQHLECQILLLNEMARTALARVGAATENKTRSALDN